MSKLFLIKSFLNHWLNAVDDHSIHSPYFFEFYNKVIKEENKLDILFDDIEELRKRLLENQSEITVQDLGAPSNYFKSNKRKISDIAKTSLLPPNFCRLIHRIIKYSDAKNIVELGTSMGLTTMYLGLDPSSVVCSFEGDPATINIALTNFESYDISNIKLIEGNIDTTLPEFLQNPKKIDLVLIDANHRYEPTLQYFNLLSRRIANKGIVIMDDIYHSKEMKRAWDELKMHKLVYGSIDLYRLGILFFDPSLNHQHYILSM